MVSTPLAGKLRVFESLSIGIVVHAPRCSVASSVTVALQPSPRLTATPSVPFFIRPCSDMSVKPGSPPDSGVAVTRTHPSGVVAS